MKWLICFLLLIGLRGTTPVHAADESPKKVTTVEGVTEYRLANGFKVLLAPDASRPTLNVHCTVLVGSRHEGYGEAGMAHLLEHMLCKGTPTHPDIIKALRDRGARLNASTSVDRTNFYECLPASDDNLEFAIGLEADRLVNCWVKREDLITEMTVVRNEFEIYENDSENILVERMTAAAFLWHNYGKTTIGNRADIERVPIDRLQAFYKKHYRVDNAVLVVTGQFDEAKALAHVAKYFGALKKPDQPLVPTYTQEPPQDGERQVHLRRVGTVGVVGAVYHIPAASHPDFPAIQVLVQCLTSEPSGRAYKALVAAKKATSMWGRSHAWHDPGIFEIVAKVQEPAGIDAARDALVGSLESLAAHPITEEEVARARQDFEKSMERLLTSSEDTAHALDESIARGDWRLLFLNRDLLQKVTAADVSRVAAQYLTRNNRTVGIYQPTQRTERIAVPEANDLAKRLEGYQGRAKVTARTAFEPTPENIESRVTRGNLGPIKTAFLPKPTRGEMVEVRLNLHYGNEKALTGRTTAAGFLPTMLLKGTKDHPRQKLVDEVNKLGSGIAISGAVASLSVSVSSKKANLTATLALVRELLREPAFPADEFAILKSESLTALAAQKANPGSLADRAAQRKLSTADKDDIHYVPRLDEAMERVKATTLDDVKALYTEMLGAQAGELSAVGDFDPKELIAALEPALAGWTSRVEYRRIAWPCKPVKRGETIRIETPDKANAVYHAALTFPLTDADPDYPALLMGTYLLGGDTFVSRLGARVRKEKGLTYGIVADFTADAIDESASFLIIADTNPTNMERVSARVAEELKAFLVDGVTSEELAAGKKAVAESLKLALAEDRVIAIILNNGLSINRTFAHQAALLKKIEALTPADIQRACRRVVDPSKLVIVEAGDFAKSAERKEAPSPRQ